MTKAKFRTNYRLWAAASVCVFVALGFLDLYGGASKGDTSLWGHIGDASTHSLPSEIILPFLVFVVVHMIAAAVIGWVIQALVVVIRGEAVPAAVAEGSGRE